MSDYNANDLLLSILERRSVYSNLVKYLWTEYTGDVKGTISG